LTHSTCVVPKFFNVEFQAGSQVAKI
jgi:hypothetical protein